MNHCNRLSIAALMLLLVVGCASPAGVDYLTLTSPAQDTLRKNAAPLSLGPVTLPDYLKRSGLARRDSDGALHYSARELWAEPLDRGIQRTLIEGLSDAMGNALVVAFPGPSSIAPDYRIAVSVRRLTATSSSVAISATWQLFRMTGKQQASVKQGRFNQEKTLASPTGPDIARGFSELLGALAIKIADAIPMQRPT